MLGLVKFSRLDVGREAAREERDGAVLGGLGVLPVQEEDVRRAFFREALGGDEARARGAACAAMAY